MGLQTAYRPARLSEVIGNDSVISALESFLKRKDHNRSLLFFGPSGTGKTTLARIVATELGAYDPDAAPGSNFDFKELNAADFRGIDMVREIRQQMGMRPMRGSCRVWLMDEAHQISRDGQEALLKCLEDTPTHVHFMLATTNPEKLSVTLKRRCTPFELHPLEEEQVFKYLRGVCKSEKATVGDDVLDRISQEANGSLGMALMMLDKVIGMDEKEMLKAAWQKSETERGAIDLCRVLAKGKNWNEVCKVLESLKDEEPEGLRRAVLGYATAVLLKKNDARAFCILDSFRPNTFDCGFAGIVHSAYSATFGG